MPSCARRQETGRTTGSYGSNRTFGEVGPDVSCSRCNECAQERRSNHLHTRTSIFKTFWSGDSLLSAVPPRSRTGTSRFRQFPSGLRMRHPCNRTEGFRRGSSYLKPHSVIRRRTTSLHLVQALGPARETQIGDTGMGHAEAQRKWLASTPRTQDYPSGIGSRSVRLVA